MNTFLHFIEDQTSMSILFILMFFIAISTGIVWGAYLSKLRKYRKLFKDYERLMQFSGMQDVEIKRLTRKRDKLGRFTK